MSSYFVSYKHVRARFTKESDLTSEAPEYAFLSPLPPIKDQESITFTTPLEQISNFISAHVVGGVPLCPASVYLEIAVQASASNGTLDFASGLCLVEQVAFANPLVYDRETEATYCICLYTQLFRGSLSDILTFSSTSKIGQVFCSGRIRTVNRTSKNAVDLFKRKKIASQRIKRLTFSGSGNIAEKFSKRTIYDMLFSRVVTYAAPFTTLRHITVNSDATEGHGVFSLEPLNPQPLGRFVSSPILVDTLLHTAGFIANNRVSSDIACICTSIEQALIPAYSEEMHGKNIQVCCTLGDVEDSIVADAYAVSDEGNIIAYIEGMSFKKLNLKAFKTRISRKISEATPIRAEVPAVSRAALLDKPMDSSAKLSTRHGGPNSARSVESHVLAILSSLCGLATNPGSSTTLSEIGVDSLLLIELTEVLQKTFPHVTLERDELEHCTTVHDLLQLTGHFVENKDTTLKRAQTPSLTSTRDVSSPASSTGIATPLAEPPNVTGSEPWFLVKDVFVKVCGIDPSEDKDMVLAALGVDSLLSIELIHELCAKLGIDISKHDQDLPSLTYQQFENLCIPENGRKIPVPQKGTVATFSPQPTTSNETIHRSAIGSKEEKPFLRHLQDGPSSESSLYLFHDGSGLSSMYDRLLCIDRNVHGVHCLNLSSSATPYLANHSLQSMEQLAASYIESTDLLSQESIILGGWSFGGVLAFEVSCQLLKHGKAVKGLVLIDSPPPVNHERLPEDIITYVLARGPGASGSRPANSAPTQAARSTIAAQFERHAIMLENYNPRPCGSNLSCVVLRCNKPLDTERFCGVRYPWLSDSNASKDSVKQWETLVGRHITVMELDCSHFDVFDPANIGAVSKKLQNACYLLDHVK